GMRVAHQLASETARKVEHRVAVDVRDGCAQTPVDHRWNVKIQRVGYDLLLAVDHGPGPGARQLGGHADRRHSRPFLHGAGSAAGYTKAACDKGRVSPAPRHVLPRPG